MGGRQAHGGQPTKAPKAKVKKNRALNAFAIAQQQHPEKIKVKYHRLGEAEGGARPGKGKRRRDEDDDEEEEEDEDDEPRKKKSKAPKGRFDELDVDEGSDSEGNEWKMGEVDSDDDSDLDSDEAFGESDEEKFLGYAFSGSKDAKKKKTPKKKSASDVNLDEDESSEEDESDLESLGEDAIDLATMLDQGEEDSADDVDQPSAGEEDDDEDEDEDEDMDSEGSEDESSQSSIEEDSDMDSDDSDKALALRNLIANLPQNDPKASTAVQHRHDGASEYAAVSEFGITTKNKLTLEDLGLPSVQDKFVKKSLKLLAAEAKSDQGKKGVSGKLAVPLARRQQDQLDRSAAYDKTKETLERWQETVKHNRRAEHLMFPLPDADHDSMVQNTKLQPTTNSKPFNELEATIQSILEESGLATVNGRTDEDKIAEYEELETKKMSLEDVKARRDQLRMARELMFREESRAKRIKKIKSKSYRRVHRREREKEAQKNQEALEAAGIEPSEDEQEAQDRRRAEERMGSKHRGSKWAKSAKSIGQAAWDEEARAGINEMAIRDEELRKRVEGRSSRVAAGSDNDYSDSDEYDSDEDEDLTDAQRLRKLEAANAGKKLTEGGVGTRLSNMKFMLKADANRKAENDKTVEQLRRELAGEESEEEDEVGDVGRRTYGPGSQVEMEMPFPGQAKKNELEEREDVSDEEFRGFDDTPSNESKHESAPEPAAKPKGVRGKRGNGAARAAALEAAASVAPGPNHEGGAWTTVKRGGNAAEASSEHRRKKQERKSNVDELDITDAAMIAAPFKKAAKPKAKKSGIAAELHVSDDDSSDEENGSNLPFAIRDQKLIARAFAGADVVGEFEAEKRQQIDDEDEKVVDNTLPGWGSWTGDGLSKKARARNKGRFLTKTEGIKAGDRKDAKLDKVIINEKRVKKVCSRPISTPNINEQGLTGYRRTSSTLQAVSHIPSRPRRSMRDLFACRSDRNGAQRRLSRMRRSRGFCSSRELLRRCRSRLFNGTRKQWDIQIARIVCRTNTKARTLFSHEVFPRSRCSMDREIV